MGRKRKHADLDKLQENQASSSDNLGSLLTTDDDCSSIFEGGIGCSPDCQPPLQRNAANERERARMRVLSKAFARLKTSLPWVPPDTKLSKLDTLRLASCYIAHLSQLLAEDGDEGTASSTVSTTTEPASSALGISTASLITSTTSGPTLHPLNLSWPFTFGSRTANSTTLENRSAQTKTTSNSCNKHHIVSRVHNLHVSSS